MPFVCHQAGEPYAAAAVDQPGQIPSRSTRRHPGAVHPNVNLDEQGDLDTGGQARGCGQLDVIRVISTGEDLGAVLQSSDSVELRATGNLVRHEDAADAVLHHDLGFADFGTGHTDGSELDLACRKERRFVGLGVGTPGDAAPLDAAGEPG